MVSEKPIQPLKLQGHMILVITDEEDFPTTSTNDPEEEPETVQEEFFVEEPLEHLNDRETGECVALAA